METKSDTSRKPPSAPEPPSPEPKEKGAEPKGKGAGQGQETGQAKEPEPHPVPPERKHLLWALGIVVALMVVLVIAGSCRHMSQTARQKDFAQKNAAVMVNYVTVHRDGRAHILLLPGNVNAYAQAQLYAQITGYLSKWYVDIGEKVSEGQLLAEINAPQVDAQFRQAIATQAQMRANLEIALLNYQREEDLVVKKVVSQQEFDQSRTTYEAAQASLQSAEANVQNSRAQQNFERIVAPFTGEITARQIDIGTLVSAGSGSAGTPLFGVAQTDPLRVYVSVPQTNSPVIHVGLPAKLVVAEFPGRDFDGKVARFSAALDPASRTLLTEVDIPNPDGALYAGIYGEVKFVLKDPNAPIIIPSDALVFQSSGPQVVTVGTDGKILREAVQVGRDFGVQMEILDGLQEKTRVVMNPTDDLIDGLKVQATELKETPGVAGGGGASPSPGASGAPNKSSQ